ncbi:MAG TPA: O-antigen ligase family protein, partial [Chitinophagales bacterium]|nr:O-antigen ligase family protein [Chitinophagales bacterium]
LVLILIYLFINENEKKAHKIIYGILAAWFFFMLHILAVRSGILLSYFFIIFYLITSVKKISRKQFALALIGIVIGITMLCTFKTVQQRFHYLKYDYQQYLENKHTAIEYTDSRRLISIGVGLEIIQENKWLGCGLANINRACAEIYRKKYPTFAKDYYYLPHSQFIFFIACFGIPLGLLVCLLFIFPATYFLKQKKYVLFFSYLGLLLFATWDAWLGTLFGNSLYLLLIGAGIKKQWN